MRLRCVSCHLLVRQRLAVREAKRQAATSNGFTWNWVAITHWWFYQEPIWMQPFPPEHSAHLCIRDKFVRSEEHTSELQSRFDLVCRLLLEKKKLTQLLERIYRKNDNQ